MANTESLDEIFERQSDKLKDLEIATIFVKSKDAMKEELLKMQNEVLHMSSNIDSIKESIQEIRDQNDQCRELLSLLKLLDERIIHMERNVPPEVISDDEKYSFYTAALPEAEETMMKQTESQMHHITEEHENSIKDCKTVLFNDPEVCPAMSLITEEEFSKIPKYMIGRHSLEALNSLINTLNEVLKTKYTFLSLGKAHARKQGTMNLYLDYKKQEMDMCKDREQVYFFTGGDYEKQTQLKLNKIKLNLFTVLRHCKRLREYRVKNDLRYILITK